MRNLMLKTIIIKIAIPRTESILTVGSIINPSFFIVLNECSIYKKDFAADSQGRFNEPKHLLKTAHFFPSLLITDSKEPDP